MIQKQENAGLSSVQSNQNPPPNSGSRPPRKAQRLRCLHRFDAQRSATTPALKSAWRLALNLPGQPLFSDQAVDFGLRVVPEKSYSIIWLISKMGRSMERTMNPTSPPIIIINTGSIRESIPPREVSIDLS